MPKLIAGIMSLYIFMFTDDYQLFAIILSIGVIGDSIFDIKINRIRKKIEKIRNGI